MSYELNNENNLECNVLFSDLFGTLLDESIENASHEACNQNFKKISSFLNQYLNQNNFLVIVTSASHQGIHGCLEIIQEYLGYITNKNKKRILWFISDKDWMNCGDGFGDSVYLDKIDVTINLINNKAESVDIALEKLKNYKIKNIGAIGDSFKEFDMLNKIYQLGGLTGIIGGSFNTKCAIENFISKYNNENQTDKLIKSIADVENDMYIDVFVTSFHNNHQQLTPIQLLNQIKNNSMISNLEKQKNVRIQELQNMFNTGLITEDDLERILYLDIVARDYMIYVPLENRNLEYAKSLISRSLQIGINFSKEAVSNKKQLLKSKGNIKMLFNK